MHKTSRTMITIAMPAITIAVHLYVSHESTALTVVAEKKAREKVNKKLS